MRQAGADARICQGDPSGSDRPDDLGEHPGDDHGNDDLGRAAQDPDGDRRGNVERRGQLPVGHEDQPDRPEREGDAQRHGRDQPRGQDPARDAAIRRQQRRPVDPRSPPARPPTDHPWRDDLLIAGHDPGTCRLEARGEPATHHQPDQRADPDRGGHDDDLDRDRAERDGQQRRAEDRAEPDRSSAGRRSAAAITRIPPRTRNAARASGQVAGRRERDEQRREQRSPAGHGAGLVDAPGLGTALPGARTWSRWRAASTSAISAP